MWYEDESTNERDTEMGSVENNAINIPISVKVTQYLGEEIQSIWGKNEKNIKNNLWRHT